METEVLKSYTDPSKPGSFSGLYSFHRNNKKYNLSNIKNALYKQKSYTLHKGLKHKFKRTKWLTSGIDDQWQIDLVDLKKLKYENSHFEYLMTCIDVFSKKAWAIPIKKKTPNECLDAFKKILESGRKPTSIVMDKGNEFKGVCKEFFKQNNILIFLTNTKQKAAVVERFNLTLKTKMYRLFTFNKNKKYVKQLPELIDSYNNSYHRSIKMTPNSVNKSNEEIVHKTLYGDSSSFSWENYIDIKFNRGDYVRISIEKSLFEKSYTANWSNEIYIISKIKPSNPPRYNIKSLDDVVYNYNFYTEELQKVLIDEFPYDTFKVLKEINNQVLVEKLNSNEHNQTWVEKKDFLEQ